MSKSDNTQSPEVVEVNKFVVTKGRRGKGLTLKIKFKNGRTAMVDHDKACEALKVDERPCWNTHKCYSSTTGVPRAVEAFEGAVMEYNKAKAKAEAEAEEATK